VDLTHTSTRTTADIEYGLKNTFSDTGVVTTGTDTTYGDYLSVTRTGATGGTINSYGQYILLATDNAGSGTSTAYGSYIDTNVAGSANADTVYGQYITTESNAGTAYGLYVDAGTGAGTEYAAAFLNGAVGIGDTTPDARLDIDFSQTSGTLYGAAAPSSVTLAGTLTGLSLDLSTNVTATGQSVTGQTIALPAVTNTAAATYNYLGLSLTSGNYAVNTTNAVTTNIKGITYTTGTLASAAATVQTETGYEVIGGALTQNTSAGTIIFNGLSVTNPNITQTTGIVTANGTTVTTGSITTGGTQNGVNIAASGVGAGTLNGLSISAITAGAGTETAIKIGSGWDTILDSATLDISGAGAITGATGITSSGTITFSGLNTAGAMLFTNSSGTLTQDTANLIWDDTNNRLGIGTNSPAAMLSLFGTNNKLRLGYDGSNYVDLTSSATGTLDITTSATGETVLMVGDTGSAIDTSVKFRNSAQNYYAGLDGSTSDFMIGTSTTVGSNVLFDLASTGALTLTGTALTTTNFLTLNASALTTAYAETVNVNGAAVLTTGGAINIDGPTGAAAMNATTGLVNISSTGAITNSTAGAASGILFQVTGNGAITPTLASISDTSVMTTTGKLLDLTANAATTTTGLFTLNANGITTGSAIDVNGPSGASTMNAGTGLVNISAAGAFTNSTTGAASGSLLQITANAAITPTLASISDTAVMTTTGKLLDLTANAATTTTGLLTINATGLTTGYAANINVNGASAALTTGGAINIVGPVSAAAQAGGALLKIATAGAVTGTAGSGTSLQISSATATATVASISDNALTTGFALNIPHTTSVIASGGSLVNISSTSADTATTTGALLNLSSTASLAGTQFLQTYSGLTTGIGESIVADGLTTGTAESITSASTAGAASGSSYLLSLARSGTNTNATHTAYGLSSTVTNTGTTSTNIAGYFSASGATNNYGLIVNAGNVGIGDTTPASLFTVGSGDLFQVNSSGAIAAVTDITASGQVNGADGVVTKVVSSGACSDTDFTLDTNGNICIESSLGRMYFRYGGAWHYVNQTAGFQIPNYETAPQNQLTALAKDEQNNALPFDATSHPEYLTKAMQSGEFLVPYVDEYLSDGAVHGLYARFEDVKSKMFGEEQAQIANLTLKTDQNVTTLGTLQASVDTELLTVSGELNRLKAENQTQDTALLAAQTGIATAEAGIATVQTDINTLSTRTTAVETSLATLKTEVDTLTEFFSTLDMGNVIVKDINGNVDLVDGSLAARIIEAGGIVITNTVADAPTIGTAEILPVAVDADTDGNDDLTGLPMTAPEVVARDGQTVEVMTKAMIPMINGSRIFTSFKGNPNGFSWIEKIVVEGDYVGFKIHLSQPVIAPVKADWWLIEQK
jgi:hypothetical protein